MRITILLTLIFIIMHTGFGWRPYKFRITSVHGECINNLCNLTLTLNKTSLALGFEFATDHELDPFTLNLILTMINADKTEKVLFSKSIDMCAFLQNKQSDQLFTILYNDMKNYGLIINKCPVKGNFHLKNYVVDTEKLPPYMPVMKTRTDATIMGGFANERGKQFHIATLTVIGFIDNSAGINRLIKINGK